MADLVDDGFDTTELPDRWKVALAFTDHMLVTPGPMPSPLAEQVRSEFDPAELTELALGLGLFHGFSKMLIALGLEPDAMDTTVLPTPAPTSEVVAEAGPDRRASVLEPNPDLHARWLVMADALRSLDGVPAACLDLIDARVGTLVGASWGAAVSPADELEELVVGLTEAFLLDVRAIDADHISALRDRCGDTGVVQTVMALAVADGIARTAVTAGR